jgi:hypothetical protein
MRPSFPTAHAVAACALLALGATLPAAAAVSEATIHLSPPGLTWRDAIQIEVNGTANCIVDLIDSRRIVDGGLVFVLEIDEGCILDPPTPTPFHLETSFPGVPAGEYRVRLVEGSVGTLVETPFTVYDETDLLIEPDLPATDDAPLTFRLVAPSSTCSGPPPAEVEGHVISAYFDDYCGLIPPGRSIVSFDYEVGPLPAGDYTIVGYRLGSLRTAATRLPVHVYAADGCVPSPTALCLGDDRFRVEVTWTNFQGGSGSGQAIPLPDRDDTGLFWFFNPANVELTVKVLDGCPVNGHYWVFLSSGSTVEYEITVTDTASDESRTYRNELGETPVLVPDTGAFATCP